MPQTRQIVKTTVSQGDPRRASLHYTSTTIRHRSASRAQQQHPYTHTHVHACARAQLQKGARMCGAGAHNNAAATISVLLRRPGAGVEVLQVVTCTDQGSRTALVLAMICPERGSRIQYWRWSAALHGSMLTHHGHLSASTVTQSGVSLLLDRLLLVPALPPLLSLPPPPPLLPPLLPKPSLLLAC